MRAVILGVAGLFIAGDAIAADYLRGSSYEAPVPIDYDWSGIYFGGQVGYARADYGFAKATHSQVAHIVRDTTIESEAHISALPSMPDHHVSDMSYGGFVGYNSQWGNVVIGLELNYNRTSLFAQSSDSVSRIYETSDEFSNDVDVISRASAKITDYGSVRGRAGYAFGWFMPYVTGGLAVGRADVKKFASVFIESEDISDAALDPDDGIDPRVRDPFNDRQDEPKKDVISWGYSVGVGVDIGLLPGVFVRGEWEFVELHNFAGVEANINTFRTAAAFKF